MVNSSIQVFELARILLAFVDWHFLLELILRSAFMFIFALVMRFFAITSISVFYWIQATLAKRYPWYAKRYPWYEGLTEGTPVKIVTDRILDLKELKKQTLTNLGIGDTGAKIYSKVS